MGRSIPLIRLSHLFRMTSYLKSEGFDSGPLLDRLKLPGCQEEAGGLFVSVHATGRFIKEAAYKTGLPVLFLKASLQEGGYDCYSPEARLAKSCATLMELFQILIDRTSKESSLACNEICYIRNQNGMETPLLVSSDAGFEGLAHAELYRVGLSIFTIRMFYDKYWTPQRIYLKENHADMDSIQQVFQDSTIITNSNMSAFTLDRGMFIHRPKLEFAAASDYTEVCPGLDFVSSMRQLLRTYIFSGNFSIGNAAENSLMSVRTLQRVLAQHETSFSRLLYQTRFEVGRELLEQSDMPVTEIAFRVGYADPTRFTHAFRKLSGMSPSAYRASLKAEPDLSLKEP